MREFTFADLTAMLSKHAGEAEEFSELTDASLDATFVDLGYDSLALLQITSVLERELGLTLADDVVTEAQTPRLLLTVINEGLSTARAH